MTFASNDRQAHLRANAAAQKQITVSRLSQAITQLEAEGRPVNTFIIKEVSGMDYMAYYRNREAFQLFQEHMNCGVTIAQLEAQVAEYLAFMERFRSSLQREEHS